jgi:hypothetical protein
MRAFAGGRRQEAAAADEEKMEARGWRKRVEERSRACVEGLSFWKKNRNERQMKLNPKGWLKLVSQLRLLGVFTSLIANNKQQLG